MANHDCNGDFFDLDGRRWYRCFWDSTILPASEAEKVCSRCRRPQRGTDTTRIEVRTVRQVCVGDFDWQEFPEVVR